MPDKTYRFAFSQDGKHLAVPQGIGAIVCQAGQPESFFEINGHQDVRTSAISPDGQWVLTGRFSYPNGIKIWQAAGGQI